MNENTDNTNQKCLWPEGKKTAFQIRCWTRHCETHMLITLCFKTPPASLLHRWKLQIWDQKQKSHTKVVTEVTNSRKVRVFFNMHESGFSLQLCWLLGGMHLNPGFTFKPWGYVHFSYTARASEQQQPTGKRKMIKSGGSFFLLSVFLAWLIKHCKARCSYWGTLKTMLYLVSTSSSLWFVMFVISLQVALCWPSDIRYSDPEDLEVFFWRSCTSVAERENWADEAWLKLWLQLSDNYWDNFSLIKWMYHDEKMIGSVAYLHFCLRFLPCADECCFNLVLGT